MERMFRQDLTASAIRKVEKKRMKDIREVESGQAEVEGGGVLEPLDHAGDLVVPTPDDPVPLTEVAAGGEKAS